MANDIPRYESLKDAISDTPGCDPQICELFFNLLQTGEAAARSEADFLARFGLNQTRFIILALLDQADGGSMRSSEIASCASVTRATMTGLLDTLEKAGLLCRAQDPHDRRASNVKITPKGEKLLREVQPHQFRWAEKLLSPLSLAERVELVGLLRKTRAALVAGTESPAETR